MTAQCLAVAGNVTALFVGWLPSFLSSQAQARELSQGLARPHARWRILSIRAIPPSPQVSRFWMTHVLDAAGSAIHCPAWRGDSRMTRRRRSLAHVLKNKKAQSTLCAFNVNNLP